MLGHSDISMTLDVSSHVLPTLQHEAMAKRNQGFGPGPHLQEQPQQKEEWDPLFSNT
jgi:hypothetical protein